jgi:hypothetical protein
LLHHRQLLVAMHDLERREVGVGAQHEDAAEPSVLLGLGAIDDEAILAGGRQEAADQSSLSGPGGMLIQSWRLC